MLGAVGTAAIIIFSVLLRQPSFQEAVNVTPVHVVAQSQANNPTLDTPLSDDAPEQSFWDSPFTIGIVWPIAFALLEVLSNSLSSSGTREDDKRKYKMTYQDNHHTLHLLPLDLEGIQEQLSSQKRIIDIEILPAGFWETSLGVDLCIGALSTSFINLLILIGATPLDRMDIALMRGAAIVVIAQVLALASILYFLQTSSGFLERRRRILWVQMTNLAGLLAMFLSFFTLGRILT
jgi:hypothetical protein